MAVRCSAQKGIFEQGVGRGSGDERDRDVYGAPIFVTGKKSVTGRRQIGRSSCTTFSSPSGNGITDEAFYDKNREGRYCEGACTEGRTSPNSSSSFVIRVETEIVNCSGVTVGEAAKRCSWC